MAETLVFEVADAETCARIITLAGDMLDAGIEISIQMRRPGDTQQVIEFGGVSHALQSIIKQAARRGIGDNEVFCALATAIGAFAKHQTLGPIESVCAQLAHNGVRSAHAVTLTEAEALPTRGNA